MIWKKTRCLDILHNLVSYVNATDLRLVDAHYTATLLTATLEDCYNKQRYVVTIQPVREDPLTKT